MSKGFFKGAFVGGIGAAVVMTATAALAGTGVGGIFNLGQSNTVDGTSGLSGTTAGPQLNVANSGAAASSQGIAGYTNSSKAAAIYARNNGGGPAAAFSVLAGKAPFAVTPSSGKVASLNSDLLDGLDATSFLRNQVPLSLSGSNGSGGIVEGLAQGGNGIYGSSVDTGASGVYGENTSTSGYGVAGRSTGDGGIAVYGDHTTGVGWSGYFTGKVHVGGQLDCSGCVGAGALASGAGNRVGGYEFLSDQTPHDAVVRKVRLLTISCSPGKMPLGGGGSVLTGAAGKEAVIVNSEPAYDYPPTGGRRPYGWFVKAEALDPSNYNTSLDVGASVICANVSP
ncbi:MAG: hypothetical protein M3R70_05175 [Actinomycetota bacterium]|nr:hypothetical protein [Actinomycetota bacterium]